MNIALTFTIVLTAALVGGMIAHRLKQPIILGYLLVGAAGGPYALGVISDVSFVESAATIGVALLMLTLGLEVSLSQLRQVGNVGLWGGIAQIVATAIVGMFISRLVFGWTLEESIVFGLIISLSSTMISMKILMDRGEMSTVHGRIMLAILILQDIGVIAMISVIPLLGSQIQELPGVLAFALFKGAAFVFMVLALGLWVLPWLMGRVAGIRDRELFILMVLVLCLGAALGTQFLGLSAVFGAFLIGLVLRETKYLHEALAEVAPLRDIFAALFFVSLGMFLDPRFVLYNWPKVIVAVVIIIAIKILVVFGVVRVFGYGTRVAFLTSAGLMQVGEFGFVLAQSAVLAGIMRVDAFSLIISSSIITMLLTPLSVILANRFSRGIEDNSPVVLPQKRESAVAPVPVEPVVIAGFGTLGQNLAKMLTKAGIPYNVVEIDPEIIFKLQCGGVTCIYGDATNMRVLTRVGLMKAKVMAVTLPDHLAVVTAIKSALAINPSLRIVARVHHDREAEQLRKMGVTELISPEYVASEEFVKKVLSVSGWADEDVNRALIESRQAKTMQEFAPEDNKAG